VSWQITPEQHMADLNQKQFAAMMQMKKIDIEALEAAK
jgi:predicted 3-demethylubiquinone-9 3-methyltransferase (glyoxalase superfamily)